MAHSTAALTCLASAVFSQFSNASRALSKARMAVATQGKVGKATVAHSAAIFSAGLTTVAMKGLTLFHTSLTLPTKDSALVAIQSSASLAFSRTVSYVVRTTSTAAAPTLLMALQQSEKKPIVQSS